MAYLLENGIDKYQMEDGLGVYLLENEGTTTTVKMMAMKVQWAWSFLLIILYQLDLFLLIVDHLCFSVRL